MNEEPLPPGSNRKRASGALVVLAALALAVPAAALVFWATRPSGPPTSAFPVPPVSESPYLNTRPDVGYVGTAACVECHPAEHQSYLRTQHAHSLAEVDLAAEPPDGQYDHAHSGRTYKVFRKDGQLWHRESLRTEGGKEMVLSEYPMHYSFGSGTHTRSYVVADDGFLIESPVTWYTSRKAWGMSPGYDRPNHFAFERVASFQCFLCHVGQVEPVDGLLNRVKVHELAIGCERCHGPGELHVRTRRAGEVSDGPDHTILRPDKLSRPLNESVCAQCHLGGDAAVEVRGHGIRDFRPGLPLTEYRIDYQLTTPEEWMPVVGHFSQMRESRCYQRSEELTCTTCHRLHHKPAEARKGEYYRNRCLTCHEAPATVCGLPEETRRKQNAQDSCTACHMPKSPTDVPHTAFTHHRIAVHKPGRGRLEAPGTGPGTLAPVLDDAHLPAIDRDRNRGLAYRKLAGDARHVEHSEHYRRQALRLLEGVRDRGLGDPEVSAALAALWVRRDPRRPVALAEEALVYEGISAEARQDALSVLRTTLLDHSVPQGASLTDLFTLPTDRFDAPSLARARQHLDQLVRLRRDKEDWLLLGICRHVAGDDAGALAALRQAVKIAPDNPDLRKVLALLCERAGQGTEADRHRREADRLTGRANR